MMVRQVMRLYAGCGRKQFDSKFSAISAGCDMIIRDFAQLLFQCAKFLKPLFQHKNDMSMMVTPNLWTLKGWRSGEK